MTKQSSRYAYYSTTIILLFTATVAGFLAIAAWQIFSNGITSAALLPQAIVYTILLITSLIFLLRVKGDSRIVAANCMFVALLSVFIAEFLLNGGWLEGNDFEDELKRVAADTGQTYDPRSALQLYEALRDSGAAPFPFLGGSGLLGEAELPTLEVEKDGLRQTIFPLAGRSDSLTIFCNEAGRHQVYQSDRFGFNNDDSIWDAPPIDVAVIGDSLVHGVCVERTQTIAANITGQGATVANLGMTGNGPLLNLAVLREYGPVLRPRNVIWFHYEGNDLGNLRQELQHETLPRYLDPGFAQQLPRLQAEIDRYLLASVTSLYNLEKNAPKRPATTDPATFAKDLLLLRRVRGLLDLAFGDIYPNIPDRDHAALGDALASAQQIVSEWDGWLIFVFLPAKRHLGWKKRPYWENERRKVIDTVDELGLTRIDLTADFEQEAQPQRLFYSRFSHPNPDGYAFFGRLVSERLTRSR